MTENRPYRNITTKVELTDDGKSAGRFGQNIEMVIDGVTIHGDIHVGVSHNHGDAVEVQIDGVRPLYRTQVYYNGLLVAEDQGRLWDQDMTRVKVGGKPG